jgi:hypothetical protein
MSPGDFDDEETLDELLGDLEIDGTNPGAPLVAPHPITGEPPTLSHRDMRLYRIAVFGWQQAAQDVTAHIRSALQTHYFEQDGEGRGIIYEHGDRLDPQATPDMVIGVIEHRSCDLSRARRSTLAVTKLIGEKLRGADYRLLLVTNLLMPSDELAGYRAEAMSSGVWSAEAQLDITDRRALTALIQAYSVQDFPSLETLGKYHLKGVKTGKI